MLNSVLKQQTLDDEGLLTMFCEVEAILNDRPITKASDDANDLEALTPNHILLLKANQLCHQDCLTEMICKSGKDRSRYSTWRNVSLSLFRLG